MTAASARSRRGRKTRTRILGAARDVLVLEGPAGFRLRAVAARAGLSLSNLQFHYRDRPALLRALLDDEMGRGLERVEKAISARGSAAGDVAAALDALLEHQRDRRAMRLYLALWSFASVDEDVGRAIRSFYARFVGQVSTFLRAAWPRLTRGECQRRARLAVALIEGVSLFRSGVAGTLSPADDRLLRGELVRLLAPPPPRSRPG